MGASAKTFLEIQLAERGLEEVSNCCSCPSSAVEIVDGLGICSACGEWCEFILIEDE